MRKELDMKTDLMNVMVAAFQDGYQARSAIEDLRRSGFREDQIAVIAEQDGRLTNEVMAILVGMGLSHSQAAFCQEASAAGQTLVVVDAGDRRRAAQLVLERNGSRLGNLGESYLDEFYLDDEGPHLVGWPFNSDSERN
jgi:hypothetical protein